ncbi:MAG: LicD family protein [Paludibacteraceae bacterium]|nr:LicD family protein [Paludibacteraceae bacterium]
MTDLEYSYPSPIEPLSLSEELKRREVNNFLREKYNPDGSDVRNYQLQLLKALKAFDEFCRNHEIKYMLAYGTLLGAARHQAFVPWDDDADILDGP